MKAQEQAQAQHSIRGPVAYSEFHRAYAEAVRSVWAFWSPAMQAEVAAHNIGWSAKQTDFRVYLDASVRRYYIAYQALAALPGARTVCDVGGFWGAFPLTLRALGYEVTMTETLQYYSGTFNGLFDFLRQSGIAILDLNPFSSGAATGHRFDFVSAMAVLEHFPHSLRDFMTNVTSMMAPGGQLYLEVPNIAFWPKRVGLLKGVTPLVPIADIYRSGTPFIGHHHEFTAAELRDLGRLSGLRPVRERFYNYSPHVLPSLTTVLRHPLWFLAFALPTSREVIAMAFGSTEGRPE